MIIVTLRMSSGFVVQRSPLDPFSGPLGQDLRALPVVIQKPNRRTKGTFRVLSINSRKHKLFVSKQFNWAR